MFCECSKRVADFLLEEGKQNRTKVRKREKKNNWTPPDYRNHSLVSYILDAMHEPENQTKSDSRGRSFIAECQSVCRCHS
jgi:hypothetical protein